MGSVIFPVRGICIISGGKSGWREYKKITARAQRRRKARKDIFRNIFHEFPRIKTNFTDFFI